MLFQDKYFPKLLLNFHLTRLFSFPGIWTKGLWRIDLGLAHQLCGVDLLIGSLASPCPFLVIV